MSVFEKFEAALLAVVVSAIALGPLGVEHVEAFEPNRSEPAEIARAMAAAWEHNRAAFSRFSCRYLLTKGRAASRQEALTGNLAGTFAAECVWAVDGDLERCSRLIDDETVPKSHTESVGGGGYVTAPIASKHFAGDGRLTLFYYPSSRGATLWDEQWSQKNTITTPFDMNIMGAGGTASPARAIHSHIAQARPCEISRGTGIDGGDAIAVKFSAPGQTETYTFDPDHGHLTSSIVKEYSALTAEAIVLRAQQGEDGSWFPTSCVTILQSARGGNGVSVNRFEVTELSLSPEANDFVFTLPEGTRLGDRSNAKSQHRLERALDVSPQALTEVQTRCRQVALNRGAGMPLTRGLPQPRRTNWWLVFGISAVVATGTWGLLRKLRSQA